jgi:hypothetical protein
MHEHKEVIIEVHADAVVAAMKPPTFTENARPSTMSPKHQIQLPIHRAKTATDDDRCDSPLPLDQPKSFTYIPPATPKTPASINRTPIMTPSSQMNEVEYLEYKVLPVTLKCVETLLQKIKNGETVNDPIQYLAMVS